MARPEPPKKEVLVFQKYIKKRNVLLVDTSATTRAMLSKSFNELGARGDLIHFSSSFLEAQEEIAKCSPQIVVTDFNLGPHSGLLLIHLQREYNPQSKDTLFIIITGDTSQTAIAQAAEEEVDSYILKPFTIKGLRAALVKAVMSKIEPSDYTKIIESGKQLLFKGDIDAAMKQFDEAVALNPKPALAYFYKGQAELMKNALGAAEEDFRKGLDFVKIHYKCLVGLFDLLMTQKREAEAYEVVKKISMYFPSHPKRLYQIIKLTVALKAFEDLEDYYEAFCNLPIKEKDLTLHMCAALVVAGKYFFSYPGGKPEGQGDGLRALSLLNKAAVSCGGTQNILKEIILILVERDFEEEARSVLARFDPADQFSSTYAVCETLVRAMSEPALAIVQLGLLHLSKGHKDPLLYETVIKKLKEIGSQDRVNSLLFEARKNFPNYHFEN